MLETMSPGVWIDAAQFLLMIIIGVVTWTRKPGEDAGAAVQSHKEDVAREISSVNQRLALFEERIAHMPTDEELAQLAGNVQALAVETKNLASGQDAMKRQLNRIEDYLLKKS
jgi:Protein of unknown function (DUF2730)